MAAMKEALAQAATLLDVPEAVLLDGLNSAQVELDLDVLASLQRHADQLVDGAAVALQRMVDGQSFVRRGPAPIGLATGVVMAVPYQPARMLAEELRDNAGRYDVEHWPAARELIVATLREAPRW